jgi:hypothetical protein
VHAHQQKLKAQHTNCQCLRMEMSLRTW